ncbi:MAG: hypothetical protein MI748_18095 [Opitutales bacterium]|nr:hypothetical protein [Opitutales bacterium]
MKKSARQSPNQIVKYLIWCYLFLLVFEGALRKWVLPGLSNQLLIVRDPLALLIYVIAYTKIPKSVINPYTITIAAITGLSFVTTLVLGHGNLVVAVFGARVIALHFPMIFVIGYFLNREDVILIGKTFLLIAIPMTLLLIAQFSSPQGAWVNRAPGGGYGASITGALGKYRPPGTFSFITGVVQFYTLTAGFLLSALFERRYFPFWLTISICGAVLIAVPISISRTLFLNSIILLAAAIYGIYRSGGSAKGLIRFAVIAVLGFALASQFQAFDEGMEAFSARWENSTGDDVEGFQTSIVDRFFGELTRPLKSLMNVSIFGQGLGLGTQAGAKLATGERGFLMGEGEWERLIFEMGSIFGLGIIVFRVFFCFKTGVMTHKALARKNLLPWLIFMTTALLVFNGQWGQPTTLGFTVSGAGLALAAIRIPKRKKKRSLPKKGTRNPTDQNTKSDTEIASSKETTSEKEEKTTGSFIKLLENPPKPPSSGASPQKPLPPGNTRESN